MDTDDDLLQHAASAHQAGQYQEAINLYHSILLSQPQHPEANYSLGMMAMQFSRWAVALPYLQSAWNNNSRNQQFCVALIECLLILDHAEEAVAIAREAAKLDGVDGAKISYFLQLATSIVSGERPSFAVECELANLFKNGLHADMERRMVSLLLHYPNWWKGWNMLCTVQQVLGKDCGRALEAALKLVPGNNAAALNQPKLFCIGANKTGTTSIGAAFRGLGLKLGNQENAELLFHDWARNDYRRIISYCLSAQAFQDMPFSLHGTFVELDKTFPNAKFVLTVRNDAEEWYRSLVRFHTRIVNKGRVPTEDDLRHHNYRYPGFMLDVFKHSFGVGGAKAYDRDAYIRYYEDHNSQVRAYFKGRQGKLLVLNLADSDAMERLVRFLGFPYTGQKMPHLNSSLV
jgi:hypothetical protein